MEVRESASSSVRAGPSVVGKDSVSALRSPAVRKALPRYASIVLDGLPAKYLIAKRVVFNPERSMSAGDLWDEHERLMQKFRTAQWMVDEGKLDLGELEIPRFSLLDLKAMLAEEDMRSCNLCERSCGSDRTRHSSSKDAAFRDVEPGDSRKGQADFAGACGVGRADLLHISSEGVSHGGERHISPSHSVFLMGCNMGCRFCQNHENSQWQTKGRLVSPKAMASSIRHRHDAEGARNVDWAGGEPTPHTLAILRTLRETDVNTPQIWNSNFYMSRQTLKLLDGIVDMYLPDFKFGNDNCAKHIGRVDNYMEVVSRNHSIAARQGEMTIRHLVLPNHFECCTKPALKWIADNLGKKVLVNVTGKYEPHYMAHENQDLRRKVEKEEVAEALAYARKLKLNLA